MLRRIASAASRAHRAPSEITLVAVTKTVPYERLVPYFALGMKEVGENKVQEAMGKYTAIRDDVKVHLIGPLQSNKAKKAVAFFDMIQSLDRLSLGADLNRCAGEEGKVLPCLIQVKISDEDSKSGLAPEALAALLDASAGWPNLRIEGLMGIPPLEATGDAARPYFERLRSLAERHTLKTLSMGMSSDFEAAIAEGSTMVRIGSALFGARQK